MSKFHQAPNTFVSHVNLKVENLERSLSFYQEKIGFQVLKRSDKKATLTANGQTPLLTIEQPENVLPKQPRTTGLYHFALLLPSRKELGKFIQHLAAERFPFQGATNHGISEALYLADPDGNGIEVYADTPPSTWQWEDGQIVANNTRLDLNRIAAATEGEKWECLPNETIMGHIHLHGAELEKIEEFYTKGLSFDVVMEFPSQALFFSTGGYHHHIAVNIWNGLGAPAPAQNSVGLTNFTLVFPNKDAVENALARLETLGYQTQEVSGIIITKDPSGNEIELVVHSAQS